jgi:5-methylcytosine-specific restriction endonuclease McrA
MNTDKSDNQDRFGTDHLPYEIPSRSGKEHAARNAHRTFYWRLFEYEAYTCPDCGRGAGQVYQFEVHHIDRDPTNGRLWNLIGVCRRCHRWRHGGQTRSSWSIEEWKHGFVDEEFHPHRSES